MTKHSKSTKANSLQAMTQDLLKNLASEDTTLPILWVGGAYTTKIMPPKLS